MQLKVTPLPVSRSRVGIYQLTQRVQKPCEAHREVKALLHLPRHFRTFVQAHTLLLCLRCLPGIIRDSGEYVCAVVVCLLECLATRVSVS